MISRSNMSANIHFEAVRRIKVIKTGKVEDQTIFFDVVPTPTEMTHKIMDSDDPFQDYRDYWCDEPIGTRIRNDGLSLVKRFDDWLKFAEEAGYEVKPSAYW